MIFIVEMSLKFTNLWLQWNLPGANELNSRFIMWHIYVAILICLFGILHQLMHWGALKEILDK